MTEPARPNASSPRGNRVLSFGHRGGPLLLGVSLGALLVGSIAVVAVPAVAPADSPVALQAAAVPEDAALSIPVVALGIPQAAAAAADVASQAASQAATQAAAQAAQAAAQPPAPAAAPAAAVPQREVAQSGRAADAVISATNAARRAAGCKALVSDPRLTEAAQQHAEDMAAEGYFSHTAEDGRTFDARIRDSGYRSPGGENIARGQRSAAEVVGDWMDSAGHRRNILDCTFKTIGVGISGSYWVQDFGR
ncbi:CAP domain-containing protein [Pseudonocardia alaniniphila]|uniref:CAP domain-containing protein n=2 Tax=Pseudonocardia alaniniphila TaxID=75291 RepID=A0ABS9TLC5_9PSEU|nr:CAP domain-containing protein [Pseudonocardia alaniniphila]MCH6169342.1 CAP domain-containing protein [Pseudonocardia alaniniphila]